ncbi:cell envelope integrity protein TolA [Ochrobactrum sp. CM-21-5]|nr:cell envelope integrity protein TolA [Ochrobactrum sp. CM-21-5]MBC2886918.1 cell envelope integrity protein TolA [Ochrobactrum sp. CM-21-5]
MKAGLTSSVALHTIVIALGLFSFSSPKAFDVQDAESLPVDIVPIEQLTQIQQGEKTAPMKEKSAPKPTTKPQTTPDAENVGDQEVDSKTPPKPDAKPKPVETAEEPKAQPEPVKKPEPKPDPKPEPKPEEKPTPVPATEVQAKPEPKQEVKPDPVAEAIEKQAEAPDADAPKLPDKVPAPQAKPKPPQAQTAKTPDRKPTEDKKKTQSASQTSQSKNDAIADEVAALLNKQKASGGGAKRSTDQASLGGKKNTGGAKLSQSEMDALRGAISKCWNVPAGVADAPGLVVTVKMRLTEAGEIQGVPQVTSGGGGDGVARAAAESAKRAVQRCAPYNLPRDKYDSWSEVIVNFDPSDMF